MFGQWLRKKREDAGLTLDQIRDMTGISRSFWHDVEQGRKSAGLEYAEKMAGVFGVKLSTALKQCGM